MSIKGKTLSWLAVVAISGGLFMTAHGQISQGACWLGCLLTQGPCTASALTDWLSDVADAYEEYNSHVAAAERTQRLCDQRNPGPHCGETYRTSMEAARTNLRTSSDLATNRYLMRMRGCVASFNHCKEACQEP